ncbi:MULTISPECIES: hypothetical protein [unclassified Roseobacter]|uniref:hypothetical protein n=1 Tax=unclassified Roseobacter TaxID=196798 RepID=UPI0014908FF4|nr:MULTISPECIES: hypothetical protein [unclassified Roseobacter]NNW55481.1 hypothetical protein [Roseobacter sp. HKCCD8284]NNY17332.1 hypothetical protein [Roseobacter sp. HKCCD8191]
MNETTDAPITTEMMQLVEIVEGLIGRMRYNNKVLEDIIYRVYGIYPSPEDAPEEQVDSKEGSLPKMNEGLNKIEAEINATCGYLELLGRL